MGVAQVETGVNVVDLRLDLDWVDLVVLIGQDSIMVVPLSLHSVGFMAVSLAVTLAGPSEQALPP